MDSLVLLCARRVVALSPLPALSDLAPNLYPLLFQLAFRDGKPPVLRVLVAAWPLPELNFQRLIRDRELLQGRTCIDCVQAVIQGVVAQLRRVLKDPRRHYSLRVLDVTGLPDSVSSRTLTEFPIWSTTRALASACMELAAHQQELQRRRSVRRGGRSRATRDTALLQPSGVDVHADLCVDSLSSVILQNALQAAASGPLRLKCRVFKAKRVLAFEIMSLLESLDPSYVRRLDLRVKRLGLTEFSKILGQLSRFPELRSLKLHNSNVDVQRPTLESTMESPWLVWQLGIPTSFQELSLGSSRLPGNLHQILRDLQAPLENLELVSCSLLPSDLAFLSQSFHAPAFKSLDVNGLDVSKGLLELLQLFLEKTSSSLLHLDLRDCRMANSHLKALLPTLLRCSRLRFLGLHGNHLSTDALKDLLQKILELPDLHLVVYPFPVDCYKLARLESDFDFVPDEELLAVATVEFSQVVANSGRTDLDWTYNPDGHDILDYFSL